MVSIATEVSLKPFTRTVLKHLREFGYLTPLQSLAAYGSARIAPQIFELREAGYSIATKQERDAAGHRYSRYVLAENERSKAA